MTYKAFVRKLLKQPAARAEYSSQAKEFALLDELLQLRRQKAGRGSISRRGRNAG
jgi:hypothetical protein